MSPPGLPTVFSAWRTFPKSFIKCPNFIFPISPAVFAGTILEWELTGQSRIQCSLTETVVCHCLPIFKPDEEFENPAHRPDRFYRTRLHSAGSDARPSHRRPDHSQRSGAGRFTASRKPALAAWDPATAALERNRSVRARRLRPYGLDHDTWRLSRIAGELSLPRSQHQLSAADSRTRHQPHFQPRHVHRISNHLPAII